MVFKRLILLLTALTCTALTIDAQTLKSQEGRSKNNGSFTNERAKMIGTTIDVKTLPMGYGKYTDDKLEEFEQQMKEREWNREDTAWERACVLNNKEAYERYSAMYPYGEHVADAQKRIIDIQVKDAMNSKHDELPNMYKVEDDEDSPTSTIVVENFTGYILTVYYSGEEKSESIAISPGGKGTVVLPNGQYSIAASVPVTTIRPFAGKSSFTGGKYEGGYYIVRDGYQYNPY